ncbi:MAG: carboxylating nicotinate-nucleotide diphosphorylase [Gammaproteobacteria bacterium]|nr:carboxylating nicotinate-nucleotide diphosphorylase [Gammaproteobacteria bacterium]
MRYHFRHLKRLEPRVTLDTLIEDAVQANVAAALAEDVGQGDLSAQLIDADAQGTAEIVTRDDAIFCGRRWAEETCARVDHRIALDWRVADGDRVAANSVLVRLAGPARGLLTAERTMLNFLQLLSGTATLASRYAEIVRDLSIAVLDTRKTIPGLRIAQKYAVRCGGCRNHRIGLFDAFLIKENHIAAAGSIAAAVQAARRIKPGAPVEVEVENIEEFRTALVAGADIIMLDDFSLAAMREAVTLNQGQARLEASGGVTLESLRQIAATGVDYVSVGEITKKVLPIDLSMRFKD